MSGELRLGVIGAGWIADSHLESVAALDGVAVTAVADLDLDRATRLAGAASATPYDDWETMLYGEKLDAILVCTPPMAHRDPCVAAVERGLGVYLEKPIARSRPDADAIRDAVMGSNAVVAVGYQYRAIDFLPALVAGVERDPLGLLASYSVGATAGRPWFVHQAEGGGQILERASHHIDLQRAIAGEVAWVQAAGARVDLAGDERPADSDIDDVLTLTLGFESGALGTVLVAWTRRGLPSIYTLDLVSAQGEVHVDLDPAFEATGVREGTEVSLRSQSPPIRRGLELFLDAVRSGDPTLVACDVEAAAGTLDVALACERALTDGGKVPVRA